jgi:DNA repair protein RecO (recombination protein O)
MVTARGARKPRSKFLASAQLFTYSDFIIYDGGRFYSMAQTDVIESFFKLRDDYIRLCLAQYFIEVCDKTTPFNAPCDELLHLLIISLSALAKGARSPYLIARAFEMKFFQVSGVAPETARCAKCGGALTQRVRFGEDGTVCECYERPAVRVSPAALAAVRYILLAGLPDIFKFTADPGTLNEIKAAAGLFFRAHFDARINSLDMLE